MKDGLNPDWMEAFFRTSETASLPRSFKNGHLCHKDAHSGEVGRWVFFFRIWGHLGDAHWYIDTNHFGAL